MWSPSPCKCEAECILWEINISCTSRGCHVTTATIMICQYSLAFKFYILYHKSKNIKKFTKEDHQSNLFVVHTLRNHANLQFSSLTRHDWEKKRTYWRTNIFCGVRRTFFLNSIPFPLQNQDYLNWEPVPDISINILPNVNTKCQYMQRRIKEVMRSLKHHPF